MTRCGVNRCDSTGHITYNKAKRNATNTPWYVATTNDDLFSGRYLVNLNNEERDPFKFGIQVKRKDFTAAAIRRRGKR